jgi:hypothetical protein
MMPPTAHKIPILERVESHVLVDLVHTFVTDICWEVWRSNLGATKQRAKELIQVREKIAREQDNQH